MSPATSATGSEQSVTRDDILSAAGRIAGHIRETPVLPLGDVFDGGFDLSLKLESLQPTGSFKVRGAFSALTASEISEAGVVAASGGNFGLAVAYACQELGHGATIFVPETSPAEKTAKIGALGADLHFIPGYYAQALEASEEWAGDQGAVEIHAYDQLEVMAGQGTCALEISHQVPGVTSVLVAVGGGGLIGGIASWLRDDAAVVGVEPELCPTLHEARRQGAPVDVRVSGVAVSSLGAARLGDLPWMANRWIDQSLLVDDEDIVEAQTWLWETCRIVAEPSACTTVAALLIGALEPSPEERVVAVISGANTGVEFSRSVE